jgi:hypothetical protein
MRGQDHHAGKDWTVLGPGLGKVGARVEEVGARIQSLLGTDWIKFGQRRSLCHHLAQRAGENTASSQKFSLGCVQYNTIYGR